MDWDGVEWSTTIFTYNINRTARTRLVAALEGTRSVGRSTRQSGRHPELSQSFFLSFSRCFLTKDPLISSSPSYMQIYTTTTTRSRTTTTTIFAFFWLRTERARVGKKNLNAAATAEAIYKGWVGMFRSRRSRRRRRSFLFLSLY